MDDSHFMRSPPEVRMMIYEYLFNDGGNKIISIRSAPDGKCPKTDSRKRSRYYVIDHSLHRRCYETTYSLESNGADFCAALMRVNRKVHDETSYMVYGKYSFDFGRDIESVEPFLSDLTPPNRNLIQEISIYKRGPLPLYEHDRSEWRSMCRFLQRNGAIKKLRLMVQAGRPTGVWEGPKEFSADQIRLLSELKIESLEWVAELAEVKGIEELEILPDVQYCPLPVSTSMIIFAAFSASIERGLADFLRMKLRVSV